MSTLLPWILDPLILDPSILGPFNFGTSYKIYATFNFDILFLRRKSFKEVFKNPFDFGVTQMIERTIGPLLFLSTTAPKLKEDQNLKD